MNARFFVYILASKKNGTLYVGVTNDLARRLAEHKAKLVPGFTQRYQVDRLVYFEAFDSILEARARTRVENVGGAPGRYRSSRASIRIGAT
jgi:putative endonuclease